VSKLGKFQQEVPVYLQKTEAPSFSASQGFGNTEKGFKMQEYTNKMGTYILSEKDMNDRKRLFNREAGRKAIVNEVRTWLPSPNVHNNNWCDIHDFLF